MGEKGWRVPSRCRSRFYGIRGLSIESEGGGRDKVVEVDGIFQVSFSKWGSNRFTPDARRERERHKGTHPQPQLLPCLFFTGCGCLARNLLCYSALTWISTRRILEYCWQKPYIWNQWMNAPSRP